MTLFFIKTSTALYHHATAYTPHLAMYMPQLKKDVTKPGIPVLLKMNGPVTVINNHLPLASAQNIDIDKISYV
jgi:hypothetical protein